MKLNNYHFSKTIHHQKISRSLKGKKVRSILDLLFKHLRPKPNLKLTLTSKLEIPQLNEDYLRNNSISIRIGNLQLTVLQINSNSKRKNK